MSLLEKLFNVDVVKYWYESTIQEQEREENSLTEAQVEKTNEKTSSIFFNLEKHIVEIWDMRSEKQCAHIDSEQSSAKLNESMQIECYDDKFVRIWDCRKLTTPIDVISYASRSNYQKISILFSPIELRFA
jgi:hypothetical protein